MAAYATRTELAQYGLPSDALTGVSTTDQDAALEAASRELDGYFRAQYGVPLASVSSDTKRHVCAVASWIIMAVRGYSPDGPDVVIRQRYDDAIAWARDVAKGVVRPIEQTSDATPSTIESIPLMDSTEERGW